MAGGKKNAPKGDENGSSSTSFVATFTRKYNLLSANSPKSVATVMFKTWEVTAEMAQSGTVFSDLDSGLHQFENLTNSNESILNIFKVSSPGADLSAAAQLEVATNVSRHGNEYYLTGEYVYGFGALKNPVKIEISHGMGLDMRLKLAELFYAIHTLNLCPDAEFKKFMGKKNEFAICCLLDASAEACITHDGQRTRIAPLMEGRVKKLLHAVNEFSAPMHGAVASKEEEEEANEEDANEEAAEEDSEKTL